MSLLFKATVHTYINRLIDQQKSEWLSGHSSKCHYCPHIVHTVPGRRLCRVLAPVRLMFHCTRTAAPPFRVSSRRVLMQRLKRPISQCCGDGTWVRQQPLLFFSPLTPTHAKHLSALFCWRGNGADGASGPWAAVGSLCFKYFTDILK